MSQPRSTGSGDAKLCVTLFVQSERRATLSPFPTQDHFTGNDEAHSWSEVVKTPVSLHHRCRRTRLPPTLTQFSKNIRCNVAQPQLIRQRREQRPQRTSSVSSSRQRNERRKDVRACSGAETHQLLEENRGRGGRRAEGGTQFARLLLWDFNNSGSQSVSQSGIQYEVANGSPVPNLQANSRFVERK